MKQTVTLNVNNQVVELEVEPHQTLLEVMRETLGLYGVRQTCGIGICGACTVQVDGDAMSACLLLCPMVEGANVQTVEGLADEEQLDPIQQAFVEEMGMQCSYCTPGMILTTRALLAENADPSVPEIKEYLAGNLCRCGSYLNIIKAVQSAARKLNQ